MKKTVYISAIMGMIGSCLVYWIFKENSERLTNTKSLLTDQNSVKSNRFRMVEDFEATLGGKASV